MIHVHCFSPRTALIHCCGVQCFHRWCDGRCFVGHTHLETSMRTAALTDKVEDTSLSDSQSAQNTSTSATDLGPVLTYTHMLTQAKTHVHTHMYARMHAHTHSLIHTHTDTGTYSRTCKAVLFWRMQHLSIYMEITLQTPRARIGHIPSSPFKSCLPHFWLADSNLLQEDANPLRNPCYCAARRLKYHTPALMSAAWAAQTTTK